MRKWNGILTAVIMVLFLLHGILGAFQLIGAGNVISKVLSWTLAALVTAHAAIGVILTVRTVRIAGRSGAGYASKNKLFWVRRISGILVMILLLFHVNAFTVRGSDVFRLVPFNRVRLAAQLLLILSLALHILTNVRPGLVTFGIRSQKENAPDLLVVLTVILVFMTAAFFIYYLRWNRI